MSVEFRREILFEQAKDGAPENYRQRDLRVRFLLYGPKGVVQFLACLGLSKHIDPDGAAGSYDTPYGWDLGYHALYPQYESHDSYECEFTDTGYCYYDGSGLSGQNLIPSLLAADTDAIWAKLQERHDDLKVGQEEEP